MSRQRRTNRWALGIWLIGLAASALVISRAQFTADLSAFLPRSPSPAQKVLVEQLRDGVVSRLMLVALEGEPGDRLVQLSREFGRQLRADPEFVSVNNGEDVGQSRDREFLWTHRYLLSSAVTPDHFSVAQLRVALQNDVDLLGSPAGSLTKRILPFDPTGELLHILERFQDTAQPTKRDGVWFSADGKRALLVLQTRAAGFDIDAQQKALVVIDHAFELAKKAAAAPGARLVATGPGVISVHTRDRIKQDAERLSLLATGLVAIVLLLVYRSARVLVLALLPVVSGATVGVAAVSLGFGSVHGITLGFGATLIGEAVDYAIYLFTQTEPGSPPEQTLPRIWPTLRLGVLTSVCGFSALLFSSFTGLAQLGLFSIAGLIVAVSVTRWVLPGLLPEDFRAQGGGLLQPLVQLLRARGRRWRVGLALLAPLALIVIALRPGPLWDDRLASLSPTSQKEQDIDESLRRDIAAPDVADLLVVNAKSEQDALKASEAVGVTLSRLIAQGALRSYDSPADVLPSDTAQRARQAALPAPDALRANLLVALEDQPLRADLFEPFIKDVESARTAPLIERRALLGTGLGLKLDSLLLQEDGGWVAMLPISGVNDVPRIRDALLLSGIKGVVLLDLGIESDHLYHTYLRQALLLSLLGCVAILVLLIASLRSAKRCLSVVAPLIAAVLSTTAILSIAAERLSIFHLVGLLLVVAVGSNYALFFERQQFAGQREKRTVASLALANICTVIGFGTLSFSRTPVLHGIGMTVAIGAVLSLLFSAICASPESAPDQLLPES